MNTTVVLDVSYLIFLAAVLASVGTLFAKAKSIRDWLIKPAVDEIREYRQEVKQLDLAFRRLELVFLINVQPDKVEIIENAFNEYHEKGGNTYLDQAMIEYRKIYGSEEIRKRLEANKR